MFALTPMAADATSAAPALTVDAFARLMAALPQPMPGRLALAVSGGPDSLALAYLVRRWAAAQAQPPSLTAFIVDHALRPGSAGEAQAAQAQLAKLGIAAEVLRWEHAPVISRLQATARAERYRLLAAACRQRSIGHLLLAHQAEDQAETILLRLAKGSGVDGLAGMARQSEYDGIVLWRPLLMVPKECLLATCTVAGLSYATDPGNTASRFARGRLRQVMPLLAAEGLTLDRLLDLGVRAADAKQALNHYTLALARETTTMDSAGAVHIQLVPLRAAPRAISQRLIGAALRAIHPSDYSAEHRALAALTEALTAAAPMPARTLHGCLITRQQHHAVITRETAAITKIVPLPAGAMLVWDNRWELSRAADAGPLLQVRPVGHPPHDLLDRLAPGLRKQVPQGRIRAALPGVWDSDQLVQIPVLPGQTGITARLLTRWPVFT